MVLRNAYCVTGTEIVKLLHLENSSLGSVKRFPATNCDGAADVADDDSYAYQTTLGKKTVCMCHVHIHMYNLY